MSMANDILYDLKEKKLWIPALLLVVLIVIAGMHFSRPGTPTAVSSVPASTPDASVGPELSLTRASTTGFARAPRVNDKEIDPFGIQNAAYVKYIKSLKKALNNVISTTGPTSTTSSVSGADTTVSPVNNNPGNSGNSGNSNPGNEPATTTPDTTPKVKTEKDDVISILVTPEDETQAKELVDVRTLSPLPDADNPFLVYVGETGDGTAQFIVASNAVATGDGTCLPSPADCSTLTLAVGQTEKFAVSTVDNTVDPPVTKVAKVSITLTDISTKKVPVDDGTADTASAARYEARARSIGAGVLKLALQDEGVGKALRHNHVTIHSY